MGQCRFEATLCKHVWLDIFGVNMWFMLFRCFFGVIGKVIRRERTFCELVWFDRCIGWQHKHVNYTFQMFICVDKINNTLINGLCPYTRDIWEKNVWWDFIELIKAKQYYFSIFCPRITQKLLVEMWCCFGNCLTGDLT